MHSNTWMIVDWAGNLMFPDELFDSFEDAEEFLSQFFFKEAMDYEECRGEYEIVPIETKRVG